MASPKTQTNVGRNQYVGKWNVLFDRSTTQWISFKPQEGLHVYPCYACRDMFGSKRSFLDHINRRGIMLSYKCDACSQEDPLAFYNPCSLLLHARHHYNSLGGQIDLDGLSVSSLPIGLAGFLPHPDVPMIYDTDDDLVEDGDLNTRFYSPVQQDQGKRIIHLLPTILLFYYTATLETSSVVLILKQMCSNIPHCKFIIYENQSFSSSNDSCESRRKEINNDASTAHSSQPRIELLDDDCSSSTLEAVTQQKAPNREADVQIVNTISPTGVARQLEDNFNRCPECKKSQPTSMSVHFTNVNRPLDETIKCTVCKYIAPSACSLSAHQRIHEGSAPFVCPECGKDFSDCETLLDHLDDVCFHLAKQVRYRCPRKNCCKVFAQMGTFTAHFASHVQLLTKCRICGIYFCVLKDYLEHTKNLHGNFIATELIHRCTVCKNGGPPFTEDGLQNHIKSHCQHRGARVYVYVCKFCRNFFRSTMTYATHLLRCAKKATSGEEAYKMKKSSTTTVCSNCSYIIRMITTLSNCPKCGQPFNTPGATKQNSEKNDDTAKSVCLLCQKQMTHEEYFNHVKGKQCRFANPVVGLYRVDVNSLNAEADMPKKRRKKHQPSTPATTMSPGKNKKAHVVPSSPEPVQLEAPVPFSGTYHCRLCSSEFQNRVEFHDHVVLHRDVSTEYQCMECGECFVVKPSLQKHLFYYHKVTDFEAYVENNECFDRNAVSKLREIVNLAPGECKQPVAENQCRVCLSQFKDNFELNKHFRMHGMAFLLNNSK